MTAAVVIDHVSRRYRGVTALDDVSVAFEEGSITGLLGRNGAGKSTLMRIIRRHPGSTRTGTTSWPRNSSRTSTCR